MKKENIVTVEYISGKEVVETLGVVKGTTVRVRHVGSDIKAFFRGIIGGEIRGYGKMVSDAREEAESRMLKEAEALGADAILSARYSTAQVMDGAAEVLVYGTAVKLR